MCVNNMKNQIYMQYVCDEEDTIKEKQLIGLSIAFLAMLMSFGFILAMNYLKDKMHLDNEEWDIENTTLADYSVEITISEEHWHKWKQSKLL